MSAIRRACGAMIHVAPWIAVGALVALGFAKGRAKATDADARLASIEQRLRDLELSMLRQVTHHQPSAKSNVR